MHSWGKFWAKGYRKIKTTTTKNPNQLPLLKSQEHKLGVGSKSRTLSMRPAHSTQPKLDETGGQSSSKNKANRLAHQVFEALTRSFW